MTITELTTNYWVYNETEDLVGPFKTQDEAQDYINDRDDHAFDVRDWGIVEFIPIFK